MNIAERAKELGLETSSDPIQPCDTYLAGRNTGPHLLTCLSVNERGWIVAVEKDAYSYNTWNCIKIIEA